MIDSGWQPPRCSHGKILLGCPHEDCDEQNEYLAEQNQALRNWELRQQQEARDIIQLYLADHGIEWDPPSVAEEQI